MTTLELQVPRFITDGPNDSQLEASRPKMKRSLTWLAGAVLLAGILIYGQVCYWLYWPEEPLQINQPIDVMDVMQAGTADAHATLTYQLDYCKDARYSLLQS